MIRAPGSCFALAHTLKAQRSLTADTYTLRFYLYNTLHMACKTTEYEMYVMHANCYVLPGIFNSAWYLCAGISAQLYFSSCIWTVIHTSGFKYICIILTAVLFYFIIIVNHLNPLLWDNKVSFYISVVILLQYSCNTQYPYLFLFFKHDHYANKLVCTFAHIYGLFIYC